MRGWYTDAGKHGGHRKGRDNLIFATVWNAGHMVPMDQPEAAHDMINQFIKNKDLNRA